MFDFLKYLKLRVMNKKMMNVIQVLLYTNVKKTQMLRNDSDVQVSDTTNVDSSNTAG